MHASAYLLSQGDLIRRLLEQHGGTGLNEAPVEGFELGAYRTFQIAIRHIEEATGLRWPDLDGSDPMGTLKDEAISRITYSPVESVGDLVL